MIRKNTSLLAFFKAVVLMQAFTVFLLIGLGLDFKKIDLEYFSIPSWRQVLLPLSKMQISDEMGTALFRENSILLSGKIKNQVIPDDYLEHQLPKNLLVANIQALAYSDIDDRAKPDLTVSETETIQPPAISSMETGLNVKSDYYQLYKDYRIGMYCTHSGETYIPDSKKARIEGQPGLINQVAAYLASCLQEKGLKSDFANTIHDYPDFNKSYTNSRTTVNNILAKDQKNLLALFDIHRDSIPGLAQGETVTVETKKAAPILIIVGTNERKNHPNWQKNLDFANRIKAQGDKMYPGLIKGVRTKAGTYNQEFFTHSLLLEFGSDMNSLTECQYSAQFFADILLEVLKEEI